MEIKRFFTTNEADIEKAKSKKGFVSSGFCMITKRHFYNLQVEKPAVKKISKTSKKIKVEAN